MGQGEEGREDGAVIIGFLKRRNALFGGCCAFCFAASEVGEQDAAMKRLGRFMIFWSATFADAFQGEDWHAEQPRYVEPNKTDRCHS